jgi:hypothetical protein
VLFEALGPQNSRSSLSILKLDHDVLDALLIFAEFLVTTGTTKPIKDFCVLGKASMPSSRTCMESCR